MVSEAGEKGTLILASGLETGRVAPGGYPPGAPTDPYLHTLEHTAPQVMNSLLDVRVDDSRRRETISLQQRLNRSQVIVRLRLRRSGHCRHAR